MLNMVFCPQQSSVAILYWPLESWHLQLLPAMALKQIFQISKRKSLLRNWSTNLAARRRGVVRAMIEKRIFGIGSIWKIGKKRKRKSWLTDVGLL